MSFTWIVKGCQVLIPAFAVVFLFDLANNIIGQPIYEACYRENCQGLSCPCDPWEFQQQILWILFGEHMGILAALMPAVIPGLLLIGQRLRNREMQVASLFRLGCGFALGLLVLLVFYGFPLVFYCLHWKWGFGA